MSVGLPYDSNLKWHMPQCIERFRTEQKYIYMPFLDMPFLDRHRARFLKKFQNTETYINDGTLRSGFFPAKCAR